jgi:hypothetical protein
LPPIGRCMPDGLFFGDLPIIEDSLLTLHVARMSKVRGPSRFPKCQTHRNSEGPTNLASKIQLRQRTCMSRRRVCHEPLGPQPEPEGLNYPMESDANDNRIAFILRFLCFAAGHGVRQQSSALRVRATAVSPAAASVLPLQLSRWDAWPRWPARFPNGAS